MNTAEKLFREVKDWTFKTFGPERDPEGILEHLEEELDELRHEIEMMNKGWRKTQDEMLSEYADVQILLWNLMQRFGVCHNRLMDAVTIKMKQNKEREWVPVVGSKKIKHITHKGGPSTDIVLSEKDGVISLNFKGDVVFHCAEHLAKLQDRLLGNHLDIVAYSAEFDKKNDVDLDYQNPDGR